MTFITRFDTATYTITELRGLLRDLFNQLARLSPVDPDYQITKASMENVETELHLRIPTYPRSHSNNIRAPVPGYPRTSDALP